MIDIKVTHNRNTFEFIPGICLARIELMDETKWIWYLSWGTVSIRIQRINVQQPKMY